MKVQVISIAALASLASAFTDALTKRADSPLSVSLEKTGNSEVKAVITNTGSEDLKLFKTGTFLDDSHVEKVEVFQAGERVAFDGIRLRISTSNLDESAFQVLAAGESIEAQFDIAVAHDLGVGGDFEVVTEGAFAYANLDSTEIAGAVPFLSNTLLTAVNGEQASKVRRDYQTLAKRVAVQSDCTGTRRTATLNAIAGCASLARTASAATSNTAKMTEYFKSTSSSTVSTVRTVFNNIATQCGSTTSGNSRYYCSDILGACSNGVLAYTYPSTSQMVNCPLFFTGLSAASRTCHAQDQQTTILHEMTHLTQVKGTSDYGGYGYNFVRSLTAAQNLNHADTYTLFAQSLYAGC